MSVIVAEKEAIYMSAREKGLSVQEAMEKAKYAPNSIAHVYRNPERKLRERSLKPLENLAFRAVKKTLRGEPIGLAAEPKHSDVMRAAEIVLDRTAPKTQRIEAKTLHMTMSIDPSERLRLMAAVGMLPDSPTVQDTLPQHIDITPSDSQ